LLHGSLGGVQDGKTFLHRTLEAKAALDALFKAGDLVIAMLAAAVAYVIHFGMVAISPHERSIIGLLLLYGLLCFSLSPLYRQWRSRPFLRCVGLLLLVWTGVFSLFATHALVVGSSDSVPVPWLLTWFVLGYTGLVGWRIVVRARMHVLRAKGIDRQRVVVVGLRAPVLKLHRHLKARNGSGIEIVGYFASHEDIPTPRHSDKPRKLGALDALDTYLSANHHNIEQVWVSLPLSDTGEVKKLLKLLERYPVPVKLVPDIHGFSMLNPTVEQIGPVPVINLRQGLAKGNYMVAKRVEDLVVASIAVLALMPLFLVLAIGVKLSSPGPVLFRQRRHGQGGKEFWMLKFRSMKVHQESVGTIVQATRGDPRVTRFGAFLRRTSLDELPQFFNVLGGSMSVVGPRPHAVQHNNHYERLIERYMHRHYVKPGITGWAQVHGLRGETPELRSMKKRVQYDIDYIRRWSPGLDMAIIVMTVAKVLGQKSAY